MSNGERSEALRLRLIRAGVAPLFARRAALELAEHREDLEAAARASGLDAREAALWAERALGSEDDIVAAVAARPELLEWSRRWPRAALALRSIAALSVLPLAPFAFCAGRATVVARWALSAALAVLLTSGLLLSLNTLIAA